MRRLQVKAAIRCVIVAAVSCTAAAQAQVTTLVPPLPYMGGTSSFGQVISAVPDLNGDGVPDLIVSAYGASQPGTRPGRVFIYCGATLQHLRTLIRPNLPGPSLSQPTEFGWSVSGVPDIDGDGFGDVIVGAHMDSFPGDPQFSGRIWVFSGATGDLIHTLAAPIPLSVGNFGATVLGLPDIDGDGAGDFAATESGAVPFGRVHVYSGLNKEHLYTLQSPLSVSSTFARRMFALPDADGDGVPEILASGEVDFSPNDPPGAVRGRAYVFSGATGALTLTLSSPPAGPGDRPFGQILSVLEDVNGDGRGDILIGNGRGNPGDPYNAGSAHLYSGATGALLASLSSPSPQQSGLFYATFGLVDLDGDGRPDFAVGATRESPLEPPLTGTGAIYLYSGATGQLLRRLICPNPLFQITCAGPSVAVANPTPTRRATIFVGHYRRDHVYAYAVCRADADADGRIDSRDISRFITGWLATRGLPPGDLGPPGLIHGDHDGDGMVTAADLAAFIAQWFQAVQAGGCP